MYVRTYVYMHSACVYVCSYTTELTVDNRVCSLNCFVVVVVVVVVFKFIIMIRYSAPGEGNYVGPIEER